MYAGKARRVRERNRAWRLSSQQMISEFLEPDLFESRPRRFVPIRARGEFMPSAVDTEPDALTDGARRDPVEEQFALPLAGARAMVAAGGPGPALEDSGMDGANSGRGAESPMTPTIPVIRPLRVPPPEVQAEPVPPSSPRDTVLRFSQRAVERIREAARKPDDDNQAPEFEVSRFLIGCAMGSMAAALVLLVARVAIGLIA